MTLAAAIFAAALSRAEIIERFKAPPMTMTDGLVRVYADCPADMRREFLSPVAGFADAVCRRLYAARRESPRRFDEPGIVVHIGDSRTNALDMVVRESERDGGGPFTRIYLPAPAFTDLSRLRVEIVRAFVLAVDGRRIDEDGAWMEIVAADPALKADFEYGEIERWMRGEPVRGDDEEMLRLCRSVLSPGTTRPADVLRFASRLYLYPETYSGPFLGRFDCMSAEDAIRHAGDDVRIRFAARAKAVGIVAFGGGRGASLYGAAQAYSALFFEIARGEKPQDDLFAMLADAEEKLAMAMAEAVAAQNDAG